MSVQAMAWAMEQQRVNDPSARFVLLCLANEADKNGRNAFPSVERIVRATGLSERTVRYKLDALEEDGVIVRGNQAIVAAHIADPRRRPVVYDLNMWGATDAPHDDVGCNGRSYGVQPAHVRGATAAPNPRATQKLPVERENARGKSLPEDLIALGVDPTQWRLFVEHHTSLGRWSGAREWNAIGQLRAVIAGGHRPNEVLQRAVARNHADLADAARELARDAARPSPGAQSHASPQRLSAAEQVRAAVAGGTPSDSGTLDARGRRLA